MGLVAQLVERTAHNGLVAGSSPAGPTTHVVWRYIKRQIGKLDHVRKGVSNVKNLQNIMTEYRFRLNQEFAGF